jgi:biopolymer transport protein ExbB
MEIQMAFFEAKAAAVTSALTLLIPVASFNSALSQENSVTAPARLAAQDDILGFLLVHFDIAYADADQSIEGAAPRPVQTASQSKSRLAAAQPGHSPANAPNEVNEMPTSPPVGAPAGSTAELPQDLSAWGMFLHADRVVKAVMIGLALASLATWAIWLAKALELSSARREVQKDLRLLANCSTLSEAHGQLVKGTSSVAQLMQGAADEIRASIKLRADGLKERIAWQLERMEVTASRKIARGTGVLATIGSTAPFVGLFGTVWGIMDSFIGISRAHTTNLAVVAPGIAEALLATALGLVAAIPAVVVYNLLARLTAQYRALLGDASAQIITLASRDLERAKEPASQAAE